MQDPITNTFVLIAADCPVAAGSVPLLRGAKPTVAMYQYELLLAAPYTLTLEDLTLQVYLRREEMTAAEASARDAEIREKLFGKPYPCMRASPLPKTCGFGVHYDRDGGLAIFGAETPEYGQLARRAGGIKVVKAMASKRVKG